MWSRSAWRLALVFCVIWTGLSLASTGARAQKELTEYLLGPGDRLGVVVFGHEDLSAKVAVGPNGKIPLPLVGQIQASGLTVSELEDSLIELLNRDFIVNPKVGIEVLTYRPFFILGEVKKPGKYDYVVGLSVRKAIAIAEGFTRRGKDDAVLLIREARDGTPTRYEAGLDAPVFPGDTIEVLRRLF